MKRIHPPRNKDDNEIPSCHSLGGLYWAVGRGRWTGLGKEDDYRRHAWVYTYKNFISPAILRLVLKNSIAIPRDTIAVTPRLGWLKRPGIVVSVDPKLPLDRCASSTSRKVWFSDNCNIFTPLAILCRRPLPFTQSLRAIQVEIKGAAVKGGAPDKGAKQGFMTITD